MAQDGCDLFARSQRDLGYSSASRDHSNRLQDSDRNGLMPLPKFWFLGHPSYPIVSHSILYKYIYIWVWVNTYKYFFSGMNIHLPAILMFTRGTRVLTHPHIKFSQNSWIPHRSPSASFEHPKNRSFQAAGAAIRLGRFIPVGSEFPMPKLWKTRGWTGWTS